MGYQKEVFSLIAKLGGTKHKIVADPCLCQFMGGLEGGVFLSQLLFWSDKGDDEWVYKSYKEWYQEIFLSEYQIRQCAKKCVDMGFLETKIERIKHSPVVHYRIKEDQFMESIVKFFRVHPEIFKGAHTKISGSINTEITTETTSEQKLTEKKDDDEAAVAAVFTSWQENVDRELPPILHADLRALVAECGAASVLRGIATGVRRASPNFLYIAECARNDAKGIKPPAKRKSGGRGKAKAQQSERGDYSHPLPELPAAPDPLPAPEPLTGLAATWATCRQELVPLLNGAGGWLERSRLERTDETRDDKPLYRLWVCDPRSIDWLQRMASRAICSTLYGLLKEQIALDIVAENVSDPLHVQEEL